MLPPPNKYLGLSKKFHKTLLVAAVLSAFSSVSFAEDFIYKPGTENYDPEIDRVLNIDNSSDTNRYDNIDILLNPSAVQIENVHQQVREASRQ